jgi:quinol monooxygenase YgiN
MAPRFAAFRRLTRAVPWLPAPCGGALAVAANRDTLCAGLRDPAYGAKVEERSDMLVVSVMLRIQPEKRSEFLGAIDSLLLRMRWLPGCLGCRLVGEHDAVDTWSIVCEWDDRRTFDRFLRSRELDILQGMRMLLRDDPRVTVDDVVTRAHSTLRQLLREE